MATGFKGRWFPQDSKAAYAILDPESQRIERERRYQEQWRVSEELTKLWKTLPAADPEHFYLKTKGIIPWGIKQQGRDLVIPLRDHRSTLWSVQRISPSGSKWLHRDGRKYGCYFQLGNIPDHKNPIIFAEGFATAVSLRTLTGLPTIMTVDAGNMCRVIQDFRKTQGNQKFLIAADNDQWGAVNTGRIKAEEAAERFNCRVILPDFPPDLISEMNTHGRRLPTDWNDLHQLVSADEVLRQLSPYITVKKEL